MSPTQTGPAAADLEAQVVVLGAGPGGYSAAFRAADLGKQVVLIERYPALGGVCLNVGCIPSKALLHVAGVIREAQELAEFGVHFAEPEIQLAGLRKRKDAVVSQLVGGLAGLAKQRRVEVITGVGRFASEHRIEVETETGTVGVSFEHAIIAAGSRSAPLPGLPDDPRIMDSTQALELEEVPERLLVIGGGIIGLEMACVYEALGSRITVVELLDSLMMGVDPDVVAPLQKRLASRYDGIFLGNSVVGVEPEPDGLRVFFKGDGAPEPALFDRILVAVGRTPNGRLIDAEKAGVRVDERGFIPVDERQRTNVEHIFAIGDVAGPPLLAHKAVHEGHTAAEVITGLPAAFDRVIPSVAYTDPEIAWVGLTEADARSRGVEFEKAVFPWSASGRALGIGRPEGFTKLLFARDGVQAGGHGRLLGAAIVGPHAGELIAEATLAIEMGSDAEDLALTVHAHPTLSETLSLAAAVAEGTVTDLPPAKKRRS